MQLVIVESPSKAKTIGKYLGGDYKVLATRGHIRDLPAKPSKSRFAIDLGSWTGEYEISDEKRDAVSALRAAAKAADTIFIASDPDREGEAIAWHVTEVLGHKKGLKRATWGEITPKAIAAGLAAARDVDMKMVQAQEARRFLDRLVGYTISPWLSDKLSGTASAGRVQSVVARLIVDRDRAIENFVPKPYGGAVLTAEASGKSFRAPLVRVGGLNVVGPDKEGNPGTKVLTPAEAAALVLPKKGEQVTVLDAETKPGRTAPKAPFITTTLTVAASNRLGLNTETTMKIAQKLYEEGLITYHRSDSPNVSEDAIKMARGYIEQEYGTTYVPKAPRQYKAKGEHAQEGHECIRPSHLEDSYAAERKEHLANAVAAVGSMAEAVFDLIWKRFVACQMADKQFDATTAHLGFDGEGNPDKALVFKASGNVTTFDGWEKAYAEDESDEDEAEDDATVLPPLAKGGKATTEKCEATSKKTTPPSAYTEATLIQELEKLNIGRPSTFAAIFATLRKRNYIETGTKGKRKNVLTSTNLGRRAVDTLVAGFPQEMDYKYTSRMEDSLDEIAHGKIAFKSFMDEFWKELSANFKGVDFSATGGRGGRVFEKVVVLDKCPKCEIHPVLLHDIPAKDGKPRKIFAACEDRNCGTYVGLDDHQKAVIREEPCPDCGKQAVTSGLYGDKCAACGKKLGGGNGGGGDRPVLFAECPKCKKQPINLIKTADNTFAACADRDCGTYIGLDKSDKPVIRTQPCSKCGQKWITPGKFGDKCAACGTNHNTVLFEKCPRCEKAPIVLVDIKGREPFAACQNKECKTYIGLKNKKPVIRAANCSGCGKKWVTTGRNGDYCAACGKKME